MKTYKEFLNETLSYDERLVILSDEIQQNFDSEKLEKIGKRCFSYDLDGKIIKLKKKPRFFDENEFEFSINDHIITKFKYKGKIKLMNLYIFFEDQYELKINSEETELINIEPKGARDRSDDPHKEEDWRPFEKNNDEDIKK